MADIDILSLPAAPGLGGGEAVPIVQGGVNKRTTVASIADLAIVPSAVTWKAQCVAATNGTLPTNTYNNGIGGVGATLTATSNGTLIVDGYVPGLNDRVLVKNEFAAANNGIYSLSQVGSGSQPWILTRTIDFDNLATIQAGDAVNVINGSDQGNTFWIEVAVPTSIGSSPLVFAQLFLQYTPGNGISISGAVLSIDPTVVATITGAQTLFNKTLQAPVLTGFTSNEVVATNGSGAMVPITTSGSGNGILQTSPTLITPNLGIPSFIDLTNAINVPVGALPAGTTGLPIVGNGISTPASFQQVPISVGVSGLATGVATFLGAPSSENLRAALTDETGTGSTVFATSPVLVTPNLGTPSAINLINGTGLPLASGVTGDLPIANGGTNATTAAGARLNLTVPVAPVTSLSALAGLDTTKDTVAFLNASGLEGWFKWNSSNLSTQVTADPTHGIYVPPASDTSGASGALVRQVVTDVLDTWFSPAANGSTDDLLPLTGLWNYCIANPGKIGRLRPGKTYAISAALPVINVTGVKIDGGNIGEFNAPNGPLIKLIGAGGSFVMVQVASPNGGPKVSGIQLTGIAIDGQSKAQCFEALSMDWSTIQLYVTNSNAVAGAHFGCQPSASLPIAADTQWNDIDIMGFQNSINLPVVLFDCNPLVTSNFSFNRVHRLVCYNFVAGATAVAATFNTTDNNVYEDVEFHSVGAGALYSANMIASNASPNGSSNTEIFQHFNCNLPMHLESGTFQSPTSIIIEHYDDANGSETVPILGSVGTSYSDEVWRSFTPTLAYEAGGGTFTSVSGQWRRATLTELEIKYVFQVTSVGTGTRVTASMPMNPLAGTGYGTSINQIKALNCLVSAGSPIAYMNIADGTQIPNGAVVEAFFKCIVAYNTPMLI